MAGKKTRARPKGRPEGEAGSCPENGQPADAADAAAIARDTMDLRSEIEVQMPRLWAQRCLRTESGRPLEFTDRPWLAQIYDDPSRRIVVQKAAQVGATTFAITKGLHGAALLGETVIYTMPAEADVHDLVLGRVNPMIDGSPDLRTLAAGGRDSGKRAAVDNVGLKRLGQGAIYFRGTQSGRAATSIPAHLLINDEVDFSRPEIVAQYEQRLDALPPGERRSLRLSTPSVPGYGINAAFEASDACEWLAAPADAPPPCQRNVTGCRTAFRHDCPR